MQQLKAFMGGDDDHVGVGGEGDWIGLDWIGSKRGGMEIVDAAEGGSQCLRRVPTCRRGCFKNGI